ncbi:MAG: helix-turn-helix transcriptional regulator [Crocinitomicaceae bacterium]|nr:helix-turn-helix transcriptional regulator [Flavobacteriales bacterium]NQZ36958.1 helix-turn-helix transcriptional regulator [Crocinitomicaceae bacterium]
MQAINKNIKKLRSLKGLNQGEFAKLFDLSRANIGSYEEGRAQPKIDTATRIANFFSISLDDFVNKELSVNDLSGFYELKENEIHTPTSHKNEMVSVSYVDSSEIRKFLLLGKAKNQISIPKQHSADLALCHKGHHLEGKDGISEGDILLLKRIQPSEIQHGFIHAFWNNEQMTVGICFLYGKTIELKGIQEESLLDSLSLDEVGKVWRLQSVISSKQRNYEYILLNNRISELEETLKKFISEHK